MLALLLLACTDKGADSGDPTAGLCLGGPDITVVSPTDGATYTFGDTVTLSAEVSSSVDDEVAVLWAVDGDVVHVGANGSWDADEAGPLLIRIQADDRCGTEQADLHITVTGGPDPDDTGDTDTDTDPDTGETGDTDVEPVEASVASFGAAAGVPAGAWKGLAVDADGKVWGAGSGGLVHLDPTAGTARVYGVADGLYSDSPTAVLAHSDGTVWVGHIGDVDHQGEQFSIATDGTLTLLQLIDHTESTEILAVARLLEQPYGLGVGDVWMGTNEGLCLYDLDVPRFAEHAHPTHPHGYSSGVAITSEGDVWNGDAYQLSRWRYSNDGDLSPSADLFETVPTWPVAIEEAISIADLDADGDTVWAASSLFGVARITVGATAGTSTVDLFAEPTSARAVRADGRGNVWIGTSTGLYRWDGTTMHPVTGDWIPADGVQQIVVDRHTNPPAVWFGTSAGLVRVIGVPE